MTYALPLVLSMAGINASIAAEVAPVLDLESRVGNVRFDHQRHARLPGIACQDCHHTDRGRTVSQGCRGCHRGDSKLPRSTARAFHDSCIGCHKRAKAAGGASGPVKRCSHCHRGAHESR